MEFFLIGFACCWFVAGGIVLGLTAEDGAMDGAVWSDFVYLALAVALWPEFLKALRVEGEE